MPPAAIKVTSRDLTALRDYLEHSYSPYRNTDSDIDREYRKLRAEARVEMGTAIGRTGRPAAIELLALLAHGGESKKIIIPPLPT